MQMLRLATIIASAVIALTAWPGMASAFETTPALSLPSYPTGYTSTGGKATLFGPIAVSCESTTGAGNIETAHTGSGKTTLHGCREKAFNTGCNSAGEPSATITTETLTAHTVYLKPANLEDPHERPGGLITPNEKTGKFVEFSCLGGLVKVVVKGNGLLGTALSPGFNEPSNVGSGNVSATAEGQEHVETVEGEKFGLEVSVNGGASSPAYLNSGTETATLNNEVEGTTTTQT